MAILSTLSIISFVLCVFIWVYDSDGEKIPEKITLPAIGITGVLVLICLIFIAPPETFTYADIQLLILLFFGVTFAFLTLAEEEKLRVILFGAALSIMILIIFLNQLFPLEYIRDLINNNQLDTLTVENLTEEFGRRLPLALEQIIEIAENPTLFFEVVIFSSFIEWEVISIVFGMSLLVAVLSVTGLFDMVSIRTIKASGGTPKKLLVLVFALTLVLSALLDNTTAIILLSGITITVTRGLDLNPIPYILAEVAATIMAGIITVIGSLPGILIASPNAGNIPFLTFFLVNSVFVVIAVAISLLYLFTIFKKELTVTEETASKIDYDALNLLDEWSVVDSRRNLYLGSIVLGV
ncbi:MAG: SLC13 family permease, partial [Candidatus Hodarchaeales archaeon]